MDPLSDVLSLLDARSYAAHGFQLPGDVAVELGPHEGVKCYAVASGECWLAVEGENPFSCTAGDCILLPRGRSFRLTVDLALPALDVAELRRTRPSLVDAPAALGTYLVGGYFRIAGFPAELLLAALPPIVHLREETQRSTMRWSLDRLHEELRDGRAGSSLIARHLACTMLIQALRLHLEDLQTPRGTGWLFALADKQLNAAITCLHADPAHGWTVKELAARAGMSRSVFALRFKEIVGTTPMDYLTRWRVHRAGERLRNSDDSISVIGSSLGYESDSAFRKAFRAVMGCSPRDYARQAS